MRLVRWGGDTLSEVLVQIFRVHTVVAGSKEPAATRKADAVRREPRPVLITDAAESPERELRRREIRYVIMMGVRALCLVGAAILITTKPPLWPVWLIACVVGGVLLPWIAVILANDRPPRKRGRPVRPGPSTPRSLPEGETGHPVIDGRAVTSSSDAEQRH